MVDRLDRISAEIGQVLTGKFEGDGRLHCTRCNSWIDVPNLLLRDWSWNPGPACPNCAARIDLRQQRAAEELKAPAAEVLGEERQCPNCGGLYQSHVVDPRSGEVRPSRYCPHCGRSLAHP